MHKGKADYLVTGNFAKKAWQEGKIYGAARVAASSEDKVYTYIPDLDKVEFDDDADYVHFTSNNTIFGTRFTKFPETKAPLACDMSSDILSREIDVSKFGVIYAGAQKNLAPAGVTIVIARKDLIENPRPECPTMLKWKTQAENGSLYNTPPCWCIYVLGLVLEWLEAQGGVAGMERIKHGKAQMLYDVLDQSKLLHCVAEPGSRSDMNVTFRSDSDELDAKFVAAATEAGFHNLKGHRKVGGMRASIYNAMPVEGVEQLCEFIRRFDREN